MESIIRYPDYIAVETEETRIETMVTEPQFQVGNICISMDDSGGSIAVYCRGGMEKIRMIQLRWEMDIPVSTEFLGDAWERTYGDMGWQHLSPCRFMPWYFLAENEGDVFGYGVKVRPSAMCMWSADPKGITLYLDVRCGGTGVCLNGRNLKAAEIVSEVYSGITAFQAARKFCTVMCESPVLPDYPVYGSNNWYYAYGDSSAENIRKDAQYLAKLTEGIENRPYLVIDDGWQVNHRLDEYNGGPWRKSNDKFTEMKELADEIKKKDLHAGIWIRLLLNEDPQIPDEWRLTHTGSLDPSHPKAQEYIKEDVKTICGWGYELIKHDFSTFDILGKWGFEMHPLVTEDGWHFYDESKTTAEVIVDFYQLIWDTALPSKTLILGCNTIGHLGAGLMQMNRTGDDISGYVWERTRKMGVNTLAFRMPQHGSFYDIDADCVGIDGSIDWKYNEQWSRLLAKSGTSLFLSVKPDILTEDEEQTVRELFKTASLKHVPAVPCDWKYTDCPQRWAFDDSVLDFEWNEKLGTGYRTEPFVSGV